MGPAGEPGDQRVASTFSAAARRPAPRLARSAHLRKPCCPPAAAPPGRSGSLQAFQGGQLVRMCLAGGGQPAGPAQASPTCERLSHCAIGRRQSSVRRPCATLLNSKREGEGRCRCWASRGHLTLKQRPALQPSPSGALTAPEIHVGEPGSPQRQREPSRHGGGDERRAASRWRPSRSAAALASHQPLRKTASPQSG